MNELPSPTTAFRRFSLATVTTVVLSMGAAAVTPTLTAAQDADFGTEQYVPTSALAYLRGNVDTTSDQWVLVDELIDRSGIEDVTGEDISVDDINQEADVQIDGEVAMVLSSIEVDEDVDFDSITESTSDPLNMGSDVPEGFAVIYQPTDFEAVNEQLRAGFGVDDAEVETSEYGGVEIEYLPPADEYSEGTAVAVLNGDTIIVATVPDDLEPIIDTANGDIDPISSNENYTAVKGGLTTDSILFGYVDGAAILDQALAIDPEAAAEVPAEVIAQADVVAGMSFYAAQEGIRIDTLAIPGPDNELPAMTSFTPTLAERMPANALVYATSSDLGPSGVIDSIVIAALAASQFEESGMIDDGFGTPESATPEMTQDPEAYAEEVYAQLEQQLGFNIKTDFIDQLVDEYAFSLSVNSADMNAPDIDAVFVSGVADEQTVADVLSKVSFIAASAAPEATTSTYDLDGTTVYSIDAGDETMPLTIEYTVIDGQLVVGVNDGLSQYIEGVDESLAGSESYTGVFDSLPTEITGAAFLNVPEMLPIIDALEQGMTASSTPDADPKCGEFSSQEEAQEAYDTDFDFDLDLDYDGQACEDYFAPATPDAATPGSAYDALNILGVGTVSYDADGNLGQSTLIAIGE